LHYVYHHRVRYRECDPMGVVYHTHYLDWFEAARTEALRSRGIAYRELEEQGILMVVVDLAIRYQGAARYDDLVDVEVTLAPPTGVRVETTYAVRIEGETRPIVTGRAVLAILDKATRRPIAPPAHLVQHFLEPASPIDSSRQRRASDYDAAHPD
jgi:acyl-CoA thioester hydrolase